MRSIILLTLAVAPAVFLLTYVYLRDRYEREPLSLMIRVFSFGVLSVAPVLLVNYLVQEFVGAPLNLAPFAQSLFDAFIQAGLVEEFFKLLVVVLVAYRTVHFNEPFDGIVYATTASLGFATMENILYVWQGGIGTGLGRALLAVPGHALFGMIMGFHLGIAKFSRGWRAPAAWFMALAAPAALHGLYDALVLNADNQLAAYLLYPLVAYLWVRGTQVMAILDSLSPFRRRQRPEAIGAPGAGLALLADACAHCGERVVAGAAFCHHCGAAQAGVAVEVPPVTEAAAGPPPSVAIGEGGLGPGG